MPIPVCASATLLASLYDGAVKVIATGPDDTATEGTGGPPYRLLRAVPDATGEGIRLSGAASDKDDAPVRPLEVPPAYVWAIWTGGHAAGLHQAERLLEWWRA